MRLRHIFTVFTNTLLEHLTHTGKTLGISHGIKETDQFNHVAFMDDITVVAQDDLGSQVLMDAVQDFEFWSNTKLNMTKTVAMSIHGGGEEKDPPRVTYKQKPIKVFQATESCRHLGFWATPNGDMTSTKGRVLEKTREVLGLLSHHPLETKAAKELFQNMAVSVFRFSAAQVPVGAKQNFISYSRYGHEHTSGLKICKTARRQTFSSFRKDGEGKSYPHRLISSPRNSATTSEGAWCTMT
jgi:hypothetical protein